MARAVPGPRRRVGKHDHALSITPSARIHASSGWRSAEFGVEPVLVEERPWERRREFLLLNAEGETPVLIEEAAPSVPGAQVIAEYLDETRGLALGERRLMPEDPLGRVEVRRLMRWFNVKFHFEVEPSAW